MVDCDGTLIVLDHIGVDRFYGGDAILERGVMGFWLDGAGSGKKEGKEKRRIMQKEGKKGESIFRQGCCT